MAINPNSSEIKLLHQLIPLNTLSEEQLKEFCSKITISTAERETPLFSQGENKAEFVYLLTGKIRLVADGVTVDQIEGGSSAARFALAHQLPRKVSAIAQENITYIRVPSNLMNQFDPNKPNSGQSYEVDEIDENPDDWMTNLLRSPIFQQLPPANLQKVLRAMEEVPVKTGDRIINQGDQGDYYYIIKRGRCELTRKPTPNAKEIRLAELKTCDTFGEDALISGEPRNVSVTMASDGQLLRLNKEMFQALIQKPVIRQLQYDTLDFDQDLLLDVRSPDQFQHYSIPDSINIPFFSLRMQMSALQRDKQIIVICDDGSTSEAACFLLIRNGFKSAVLKGGVQAVLSRSAKEAKLNASTQAENDEEETNSETVEIDELTAAQNALAEQTEKLSIAGKRINELSNEIELLKTLIGQKESEISVLKENKPDISLSSDGSELPENKDYLEELNAQKTTNANLTEQLQEERNARENLEKEIEILRSGSAPTLVATSQPEEAPTNLEALLNQLHALEVKNLNLQKKVERTTKIQSELERVTQAFEKLRHQSQVKFSQMKDELEKAQSMPHSTDDLKTGETEKEKSSDTSATGISSSFKKIFTRPKS